MNYRIVWVEGELRYHPLEPGLQNGSKELSKWLEKNCSFQYLSEHGNITVLKDAKSYWTASKKVNGRLRRKRLGRSDLIDEKSLSLAAYHLCDRQGYRDFLELKAKKREASPRGIAEQNERLKKLLEEKQEENKKLKRRIEELAIELAAYKYAPEDDI